MEKIVKLEEFNWVSGRDAITIALCNTIIRKQNEIIDYLNSQSQPEKKGITSEEYNKFFNPLVKDTPEEWVEDLWGLLDFIVEEDVNKKEIVGKVRELLDDREREVLENMRDWVVEYTLGNYKVRDFDAEIAIGKIIDRELDNLLNSKKK